jgi:hypothetical protein
LNHLKWVPISTPFEHFSEKYIGERKPSGKSSWAEVASIKRSQRKGAPRFVDSGVVTCMKQVWKPKNEKTVAPQALETPEPPVEPLNVQNTSDAANGDTGGSIEGNSTDATSEAIADASTRVDRIPVENPESVTVGLTTNTNTTGATTEDIDINGCTTILHTKADPYPPQDCKLSFLVYTCWNESFGLVHLQLVLR